VAKLAGVPPHVIRRSRELLSELESNFSSDRRAPVRSSRGDKPAGQLYLFGDPADEVVEEIRALAGRAMSAEEALQAIQQWRGRLDAC
jgi:DNA mismatch repair ATPase MutS